MSAANWGFWEGGGVNIFFRGRNVHQVTVEFKNDCVLGFIIREILSRGGKPSKTNREKEHQ